MNNIFEKVGGAITGRRGIGRTLTVSIILAVVLFNILAYTLTSAFNLYIYSEEKEDLSISGKVDIDHDNAVLLGKKVKITFCYSESSLENHDTGSLVLNTARQYEEKYPDLIELHFVNMLTKLDENMNIFDFDAYKKDEANDVEFKINESSVIFECGDGASRNFRVITDTATSAGFVNFYTLDSSSNVVAYNGEEVMASMISWVLKDDHPKVYLTQNHGESADVAFSNMLTCAGYYVDVINLRKEEIPTDAGMVIISSPTSDFERGLEGSVNRSEIERLESYLSRGGKLYVALDPYGKHLPNLEALLGEYGIAVSGGINENGTMVRDIVKESADAITTDGYTFVAAHADNERSNEILERVKLFGSDRVLMSNVASLVIDKEKGADSLLVSGSTSETYRGGKRTGSEGGYTVAAYSERTEESGKKSLVFVLPTAYITATDAFISEGYSNKDFLYALFDVLFESPSAPYGARQVLYRSLILENFTMGRAKAYAAIIMAIPVALSVLGTVIIVKRKNR